MDKRDPIAQRQSNGKAGEWLTAGLLSKWFVVGDASIDRDGTDLRINPLPRLGGLRDHDEEVVATGYVQAKFFEPGGHVELIQKYAVVDESTEEPRPHYFVFIHTFDDNEDTVTYFLTARDVLSLPKVAGSKNRRFAITQDSDKNEFIVKGKDIKLAIELGMEEARRRLHNIISERGAQHRLSFYKARTSPRPRRSEDEYHLLNIRLPANQKHSAVCEAKVAIARSPANSIGFPIDGRWDLFESAGTFSWGYVGSGAKLLSASILAHYLGGEKDPTWPQIEAVLYGIIAGLAEDAEHIVFGTQIDAVLNPSPVSAPK